MIHLLGNIPEKPYIACSGGVDSMVALDFLLNGRYKPVVLNFNHGTEFGDKAEEFLRKRCKELNLSFMVGKIQRERKRGESIEEYWRNERYKFFGQFANSIITAHHLDDAVEWWLFSALHGEPKLIPYRNGNVIRPFLLTPKSEIRNWAERKGIQFLDDPSNADLKYMRTIIRHQIKMPALKVNPGLRTVVKKRLLISKNCLIYNKQIGL